MPFIHIISTVAIISGIIFVTVSLGNEDLTAEQKEAFDELKSIVLDKLPDDYAKDDLRLMRFLRAKKFDVEKAEKLILRDVKWRVDNKMDSIHLEDFGDVEGLGYKIYLESVDREGKPIITANVGRWNLRKATSVKTLGRLKRYFDRNMELATRKVQVLRDSGKNITQWDFLINGETNETNINLDANVSDSKKIGCKACIPLYVHMINSYEQHYPEHADKFFIFNVPKFFEQSMKLIRSLLSPSTNKSLVVFSTEKELWQPALLKFIESSELPPEYGGTKIYSSS